MNVFVSECLLCCLSAEEGKSLTNIQFKFAYDVQFECVRVSACLYASHKQLQAQMVFTYLYDFTQIFFPSSFSRSVF